MHDPYDVHDELKGLGLAVEVVDSVCVVDTVHQNGRQHYQDEIESKPCQVQFLVSQEVLCLLIQVGVRVRFLEERASDLVVSDVYCIRTHVAIEDNCFHEHPEISRSSCLHAVVVLTNIAVLTFDRDY